MTNSSRKCYNQNMKKVTNLLKEKRFLLKPFLALCLIYLVAFSAILLAGVHYADDVARTNYGYPGWAAFGRYLSTASSLVLHADRYLTNIAPLPQLIAIVLLAVASVVLICLVSGEEIFKEKWTKWIWRLVAVTPLVLCPYFLECFSYQYDAPYMALSILFAVTPFMLRRKSLPVYLVALVVGVFGCCMTYQPSIGIALVLMIFLAVKNWNESEKNEIKKPLMFLVCSGAVTVLVAFVFEKFLTIDRDIYVSTSTPELNNFLPEFFNHLRHYYDLVVSDFRTIWLVLVALVALVAVVMFALRSKRNKIVAGLVMLVGVVLMAVAVYAPYSALARPLYATRAMYPIGALVATLGVYVVSGAMGKGWRKIVVVPAMILAWCFFVFAFTYGNALKEQNDYRNFQVAAAIQDVSEILPGLGEGEKIVQADGQIGYAPIIEHMPDSRYLILKRLMAATFGKNVPWMAYQLTQRSGIERLVYKPEVNLAERGLPTLKETEFYTIYGNDEGILVKFKGEELGFEY